MEPRVQTNKVQSSAAFSVGGSRPLQVAASIQTILRSIADDRWTHIGNTHRPIPSDFSSSTPAVARLQTTWRTIPENHGIGRLGKYGLSIDRPGALLRRLRWRGLGTERRRIGWGGGRSRMIVVVINNWTVTVAHLMNVLVGLLILVFLLLLFKLTLQGKHHRELAWESRITTSKANIYLGDRQITGST